MREGGGEGVGGGGKKRPWREWGACERSKTNKNKQKTNKQTNKQKQKLGSKWNIYNVEWKDPIVNGKKVGRGEGAETVK